MAYSTFGNPGAQGPGGFAGSYGQYQNQTQNPNGSIDSTPTGITGAQAQAMNQQSKYNYGTNEFGNGGPSQAARDASNLASIPVNAQMARFNAILPLLSAQFGKLNNGFATAGGQNGTPPPISAGPVLNPQQIQQQVNLQRSANDQSTAGQIQQSNQSLAGRGFGSNSPLAAMLNSTAESANRASNTANETNTRLNAAQMNSQNTLNTQQALSNQWATGNQLDIQRRAPIFAQQNALIAALGGLV